MNRLQSKLEKIGRNHITTAKAVGLRYVANSNNGFSRERSPKFPPEEYALIKLLEKETVSGFLA